jgi:PAS domain S-box-containing protein
MANKKKISSVIPPILQNLNVAVFRTENQPGGGIIDVNPAFLDVFGYTDIESLSKVKAVDLYADPKERDRVRKLLDQQGFLKAEENMFKRANGSSFPGRVSAVIATDKDGQNAYIDGVIEDVSEFNSLLDQLHQKQRDLEDEKRLFFQGPVVQVHWPESFNQPLQHISENVKDVLGYDASVFISGELLYPQVLHPEDIGFVEAQVRQIMASTEDIMLIDPYRLKRKDGQYIWVQEYGYIKRDAQGQVTDVMGYIYDVTTSYELQRKMAESELRYRSLVENSPTGIIRIDTKGNILDVNPQMLSILGSPSVEATKKFNLFDFAPLQEAGISERFQEAIEKKTTIRFNGEYESAWGKYMYYHAVINPVFNAQGQVIGAQGNMEDATEAKKIRDDKRRVELQQLEERNIFVAAPIMMFKWRKHGHEPLENVTENVTQILGYTPEDLKNGTPLYAEIIHPADVQRVLSHSKEMMEAGEDQFSTVPYRLKRKDGTYIWVNDYSSIIRDAQGNVSHVNGIVYDISDTIEAERVLEVTETTYREIFNATNEAIFIHDAETFAIVDVNDTMLAMFECTHEQALSSNIAAFSHGDHDHAAAEELMRKARMEGPQTFEWHSQTLAGRPFWTEVKLRWARLHGEERFLATARDVSERRSMERALRMSLEEQEVLTREVHHRVKNNMQVINSILNLQAEYTQDPALTNILKETQNRIRSMALIHEKLFKSKSMAQVEFDIYLQSLIREVVNFYSSYAANVRIHESIESVRMEITSAIPCGLIVNELLTNCLKYAFPDKREGEIWVRLVNGKDGFAEVNVQDNGIGLPESIDFESTQTMGLRIIRILIEQLNGSMEIKRDSGTSFTFRFRLQTDN